VFKRALRAVTTPPRTPERALLREAQEAQSHAERALQDQIAKLQRVQALTSAVESAEAAVVEAKAAIESAVNDWVTRGAPADESPVPQALRDRMSNLKRVADEAHAVADGARAELPEVQKATDDARDAIERARDAVRIAACAVMRAEIEPCLVALRQAHAAYMQAIRPIWALRMVTHGAWGASVWGGLGDAGVDLERLLQELAIPSLTFDSAQLHRMLESNSELREASRAWAEYGARLRIDADAVFDQ